MGKRRVPARDVPAINQARLDELLQGGDLCEGDMGDLFALLRGRGTDAEQRGDQCSECAGPVYLDPERAHHFCSECSLVQSPRYHFADCYEDNERITCPPREGYKPVHHLHERLAQYHLLETSICPADWATIVERLLFERPAVLDKESVRRLMRRCNLQRYNESWLQVINRVTRYRPPAITQGETLLLARIFEGVQEPFRLFKQQALQLPALPAAAAARARRRAAPLPPAQDARQVGRARPRLGPHLRVPRLGAPARRPGRLPMAQRAARRRGVAAPRGGHAERHVGRARDRRGGQGAARPPARQPAGLQRPPPPARDGRGALRAADHEHDPAG
mmetsp:Transcript_37340/g.92912  ORF Transcript_37340/g.92912 Transcript_37340/m.92912 type:complete len:334 (-) Transcript_37340:417-1418(-)